jgi:hypothetical protein
VRQSPTIQSRWRMNTGKGGRAVDLRAILHFGERWASMPIQARKIAVGVIGLVDAQLEGGEADDVVITADDIRPELLEEIDNRMCGLSEEFDEMIGIARNALNSRV